MKPYSVVHAATIALATSPCPQRSPSAASQPLPRPPSTSSAGLRSAVWEMTPGVMNDVEVDEVFVVLSGSATVQFATGSPTIQLGPGDLVRFAAGAETVWTVTETLRKVYLTAA